MCRLGGLACTAAPTSRVPLLSWAVDRPTCEGASIQACPRSVPIGFRVTVVAMQGNAVKRRAGSCASQR